MHSIKKTNNAEVMTFASGIYLMIYVIERSLQLLINNEVIEVIAENGVKKTYYITIKKINDNNEISRISIDGNEVSLQEMK